MTVGGARGSNGARAAVHACTPVASAGPSKATKRGRTDGTRFITSKEPFWLRTRLVVTTNGPAAWCQRVRLDTSRARWGIVNSVMDAFLELSAALTHRACDLRDPLGPKEKHYDHQNHQEMRKA